MTKKTKQLYAFFCVSSAYDNSYQWKKVANFMVDKNTKESILLFIFIPHSNFPLFLKETESDS